MDPVKTCAIKRGDDHDRQFVDKYIRKALKENRDKKIIFIPYHQELVISLSIYITYSIE